MDETVIPNSLLSFPLLSLRSIMGLTDTSLKARFLIAPAFTSLKFYRDTSAIERDRY